MADKGDVAAALDEAPEGARVAEERFGPVAGAEGGRRAVAQVAEVVPRATKVEVAGRRAGRARLGEVLGGGAEGVAVVPAHALVVEEEGERWRK